MTLRQNIRNFLTPMTPSEIVTELQLAVSTGDEVRAGYISEFLDEVIDEIAEFVDPWDDGDEAIEPVYYA